jgi:hypothetical protein
MSLLKFKFPKYESPPGRYRWFSPLGGPPIVSDDRREWLDKIKAYCRDNNIELAPDWREKAEDALCRVLPPGLCTYADGTNPASYIDARLDGETLRNGMAVLASVAWDTATGGNALVDREEAERRARICASCPANVGAQGCSACAGIADQIIRITGGVETTAHQHLRHCAICGCSNRAQVWVKADHLVKGVTPKMWDQFELVSDWCWKAALKESEKPA